MRVNLAKWDLYRLTGCHIVILVFLLTFSGCGFFRATTLASRQEAIAPVKTEDVDVVWQRFESRSAVFFFGDSFCKSLIPRKRLGARVDPRFDEVERLVKQYFGAKLDAQIASTEARSPLVSGVSLLDDIMADPGDEALGTYNELLVGGIKPWCLLMLAQDVRLEAERSRSLQRANIQLRHKKPREALAVLYEALKFNTDPNSLRGRIGRIRKTEELSDDEEEARAFFRSAMEAKTSDEQLHLLAMSLAYNESNEGMSRLYTCIRNFWASRKPIVDEMETLIRISWDSGNDDTVQSALAYVYNEFDSGSDVCPFASLAMASAFIHATLFCEEQARWLEVKVEEARKAATKAKTTKSPSDITDARLSLQEAQTLYDYLKPLGNDENTGILGKSLESFESISGEFPKIISP